MTSVCNPRKSTAVNAATQASSPEPDEEGRLQRTNAATRDACIHAET
jgi:hypothetical protein